MLTRRTTRRSAPGARRGGARGASRRRGLLHSRLLGLVAVAVASATALSGCTTGSPSVRPSSTAIRDEPNTSVFEGGLFVQHDSLAHRAETKLSSEGRGDSAAAAETIAKTSVAIWLGDQYSPKQVAAVIRRDLKAAEKQHTTPVFVTYAIPHRDCGDYSAGGLSATEYPKWTKAVATALTSHRAVVIVEPDSLAMLSNCPAETDTRIPLIRRAVDQLASAGVAAYLDAGNSHWVEPAVMAKRLERAGIAKARGFFTNVASFYRVDQERAYAEKVADLTGHSHYVIDVSRNGQGWRGTWCNPTGAGLGQDPHVTAGTTGLDALLWIKSPGISDGTCNGGPEAGTWFASYATALVDNRKG